MTLHYETIDEQLLNNDVAYRVAFLGKFMGFGEEDIVTIHSAAPLLAPLVPVLVDAVYEKLFAFSATKRHFVPRQHGFEGDVPKSLEELELDHQQIAFRKNHLAGYLVKLVTSPYDGKMLQYLDWVGRIHTAKTGNPHIVIPLVQVNALFGFVNDALISTIQSFDLEQSKKTQLIRSFTKLLWIQSDLFSRHYVPS
ncbi:MAG: protoglobin family protein [Candidatus Sumerlaeia bacterium]|nr:protoglobin family protein [Candidatus Sumerlaeia bacterium]